MLPSLARRNSIVVHLSQQLQHFYRRFLFFCGNSSLSLGFFVRFVHQSYDAETNIYHRICTPFLFCKIDTREDANIHIGDRVQIPFK